MRTKITLEPSWPDLDRWWRKSPYFRLDHGHEVPIDGGGLAYGAFWKPKAFTAWTYEIVRRLPYFKAFEKRIAANDLSDLKNLPPFPKLTFTQANCLLGAVLERPPIRIVRSRHSSALANYTAPLPPLSFDRSVFSKKAILEWVGKWIDAEDERLGLATLSGPGGGKSRNRDQKYSGFVHRRNSKTKRP